MLRFGHLVAAAILLVTPAAAATLAEIQRATTSLKAYLERPTLSRSDSQDAARIIRESQAIVVFYERKAPTSEARQNELERAIGQTLREVRLDAVSAMILYEVHQELPEATPLRRFQALRQLIEAGYTVKSLELILLPPETLAQKTAALAREAAFEVARAMIAAQAEFPELRSLPAANFVKPPGAPGSSTSPSSILSDLNYEQGDIKHALGAPRPTTSHWCDVTFSISRSNLDVPQTVFDRNAGYAVGSRTYRALGVAVFYLGNSDNRAFNVQFGQWCEAALKALDKLNADEESRKN